MLSALRCRMECSWTVLLLLGLAFLAVQYVAIRKITLRDSLNASCEGAHRCHSRHHGGTLEYLKCHTQGKEEDLSLKRFIKGRKIQEQEGNKGSSRGWLNPTWLIALSNYLPTSLISSYRRRCSFPMLTSSKVPAFLLRNQLLISR